MVARKHRVSDPESTPGVRAIDTASLVFGLVAIPVRLYSTSEPTHEVHFHMIHAGCGQRLKQQYVCPTHGVVDRADIAKGFQPDKRSIIELSKTELAALEAVGHDEIALAEFVPASSVDPIYIDRTYYLGPDRGGARAYRLLHQALADTDLVGIASFATRGKAYVVMVRPFETGLALHQLRYPDEIKPWSVVGLHAADKPAPHELQLARELVTQRRSERFDPSKYHDEVKDRVRAMLAAKIEHGETIATPDDGAAPPPIRDLMAALKASLSPLASDASPKPHPSGRRRSRRRAS